MAQIIRHECERTERDIVQLRSVIAPVTERFCSVETNIKQLQSRVQGFQHLTAQTNSYLSVSPSSLKSGGGGGASSSISDLRGAEQLLSARVSIGVYGAKRSGKSSLVSCLVGHPDLIPKNTKVALTVMPSRKDHRACLRLPDGKAVAIEETAVRRLLSERSAQYSKQQKQQRQRAAAKKNNDRPSELSSASFASSDFLRRADGADSSASSFSSFFAAKVRLHVSMDEFLPQTSSLSMQRRQQLQQQALAAAALHHKNQAAAAAGAETITTSGGSSGSSGAFNKNNSDKKATRTAASLLGTVASTCDIPWCIIDHPPDARATHMRFSSAAINCMSPLEFSDDVIFYVVDARVMGTAKEVDVFDNLVHLHPEEKKQLRAASAYVVGGEASSFSSGNAGAGGTSVSNTDDDERDSDDDDDNEEDDDDSDGSDRRSAGDDDEKNDAVAFNPNELFAPATTNKNKNSFAAGGKKQGRKKKVNNGDGDDVAATAFVTSAGTRRRLAACTYFFLTHIDAFPDSEAVLSRGEKLNAGQAQIYDEGWSATHGQHQQLQGLAVRSAEFALRRFGMLAEFVLGAPVQPSRVIATSAVGIAHCKAVLSCRNVNRKCSEQALAAMFAAEREAAVAKSAAHRSGEFEFDTAEREQERAALVHRMYNFAEWFMGPKFVQRADKLPFDELRRIVLNFATHRASITSGAKALDSLMSVVLHNLAGHFFLSVCNAAAEVADSLAAAGALGDKVVVSEVGNAHESEAVLVREYDWVTQQIDSIQRQARLIPERAARGLEEQLTRFRESWMEELCDVFARKPHEFFKNRQIATVRDIQAALVRYDAFSDQFAAHYRYLNAVAASSSSSNNNLLATATTNADPHNIANATGSGRTLLSRSGGTAASGSSRFIRDNISSLYDAAMKSRADKLFEVNTCVSHHLRDEVLAFVRNLAESSATEQGGWLVDFGRFCRVPISNARTRFFQNRELRQKISSAPSAANSNGSVNGGPSALRLQRLTEALSNTAAASQRKGPRWLALSPNGDAAVADEAIFDDDDDDDDDGERNRLEASDREQRRHLHDIVREDIRQLNIYCREVIEPVTAAQAELVLLDEEEQNAEDQQQQRALGDAVNNGRGVTFKNGNNPINNDNNNGDLVALNQLRDNKRDAASRKRLQERNTRIVTESTTSSDPGKIRHRFIYDAWRLALFSLRLEQVCHFDIEPFIAKIAALTAAAVDAMAEFRETLSIGIEEHAEIVSELEQDLEALDALRETLPAAARAISSESAARYGAAVNAPSCDEEILELQKRLGIV